MPRKGWLKIALCGLFVGAADIVPGISGGTVAFIIGIYQQLLQSINTINLSSLKKMCRGDFSAIAWKFLLAFLLGVSISFLTLAKGIQYLLNNEALRPLLYSAFMGLVVGSSLFCARLIPKMCLKTSLLMAVGAILAWLLTGCDLAPKNNEVHYDVPISQKIECHHIPSNFDFKSNTLLDVPESHLAVMAAKRELPQECQVYNRSTGHEERLDAVLQKRPKSFIDLWVVSCGVMAISAMLLPGISGSYILNILGMYGFILGALVDWVEGLKNGYFDFASFRTVLSMAFGIFLGAVLLARVVNSLFRRYYEPTLALLVGFMVGALRSVWPFWTTGYQLSALRLADGPLLQVQEPIMPDLFSFGFLWALLFFALGVGTVFVIESVASKKKSQLAI